MTNQNAAKPLIKIQSLCAYIGSKKLVNELSFSILPGEKFALVGESGSGKSLSAQSILRLNPDIRLTGSVFYAGKDLISLSERALRQIRAREIGMIFQEPMSALNPVMSVGKQIGEVLQLHLGLSKNAARARSIELLKQTGIDDERKVDAYPFQLSGGQRQRAMIAIALSAEPKLLIADEPTTALDVAVQAQIIELLNRLQKERGMAVLFITHDLNLVRRFADKVAVMQDGRIVEQGLVSHIFRVPEHPHTKDLLSSRTEVLPREVNPKRVEIRLSCQQLGVSFSRRIGLLRREVIPIVEDVSLSVGAAQTLGIVGESGSGKTTLGLALMRLINSQGAIELSGVRLDQLSAQVLRRARRDFQVVFQDPFSSLSPRMTIEEIVGEGLALHEPNLNSEAKKIRVIRMLAEVGLADESILSRYPHEFSGGQRQRIAIARTVILRPKVLMLDEPTSSLDASLQKQVIALLMDLQRKYSISYLFISHDLGLIRAIAHNLLVLRFGRMVEYGDTAQVFSQTDNQYTKDLLAASALI